MESWNSAADYETFMGRWSRQVAAGFLRWLGVPPDRTWLDFGCGSGALAQTVLAAAAPRAVVGCDPSADFVSHARRTTSDDRATFLVAGLSDLPGVPGEFDVVVSGLVLNFLPDPPAALAALVARARAGGTVAVYVWDYAEGMRLLRVFWDAAAALDPAANELDEAVRFPLCSEPALCALFERSGLRDVQVAPLTIPTPFTDFDDYWTPFLGTQGPAPGYVRSLSPARRDQLREAVRARLPFTAEGALPLHARAWAARGTVAAATAGIGPSPRRP